MNSRITGLPLAALFVGLIFPLQIMAACQASGLQIQVLGSGGPGASSGRASSGYLLWLNGQSKVLIDAGGGTKTVFHQSGASVADIELIAMSHFHPDHSADLPAILWPAGAAFSLAGPEGSELFPSIASWARLLFEAGGAFAVLEGRLEYSLLEVESGGGYGNDYLEQWRA